MTMSHAYRAAGRVVPMPAHTSRLRDALTKFSGAMRFTATRLDSWVNTVTGFGTDRDKTTYGHVLPNRILSDPELSALYHSDDMAARMVDVVPQEMLREGFTFETGEPEVDDLYTNKFDALNARTHLADGLRWGRCFGGGGVLLGSDDGRDAALPLVAERADDLSYLYTLDRRMLWPLSYYDEPGHPKLGKPRTYLVTMPGAQSFAQAEVHESRIILFGGAPTGIRERIEIGDWDLSVLQRAYDVLRQFNTGWKSVETMMVDGNQAIFRMGGLEAILSAPGGGEEMLRQRLQAMDLYRSVMRAIVVDADGKESFERHSVSFSEIPQTLDKFMLRLAATVEMPVTILMGQSPAGMNATGESDFRWFYDRIRSKQGTELTPRIRRIAEVWSKTRAGQEALRGRKPKTFKVKYPPLWTETPLAQAQRELAIAQRDETYVRAQVLTPDEVALHRFQPDGFVNEITLTKESVDARKRALEVDLASFVQTPALEGTPDPNAPPTDGAANMPTATAGEATDVPELTLAPTDLAVVVKVNEARASMKLPKLTGPEGEMMLAEYKAKNAEVLADIALAEQGRAPGDGPAPSPFGGGGGPPGAGGPPPSNENEDPGEGENEDEEGPTDDDVERAMPFDVRTDATRPRTFYLFRKEDETGVSGTGEIAHGVLFADGKIALRWTTSTASTTLFDSIEHVLKVHGHGGKTELRWCDEEDGA